MRISDFFKYRFSKRDPRTELSASERRRQEDLMSSEAKEKNQQSHLS